jgi:GT2 family glycosyltransferase
VTISIVSFNTRQLLFACLASVFASKGVTFEVHVVDNGSTDESADMVAQNFPQARLTRSVENRGFAAANNTSMRIARGRYVLLLNPDTLVPPDAIAGMVAFMDAHGAAGICGPRILFGDGSVQSCGYRFPTLLSEIRQSQNLGAPLRWLFGHEPTTEPSVKPVEVDWVDGACFLIRREAVNRIGLLDEQFFLYAEELDWCARARNDGWLVYALPQIDIVHYQGQSSAQSSDFSLAHLVDTRLRYYRKHHGLAVATLTSLVYVAGCIKQLNRDRRKAQVKLTATARWWRTLLT